MRRWPAALLALFAVTGCQGSYTLQERDELEGDDPGECADGADNDADDRFDCDDDDCANAPDCQGCADADADAVCDDADACPGFDDAVDADGDGVADGCDPCPTDDPDDSDADGVCDRDDACPGSDDTANADGDGAADGCDPCPADPGDDSDGDGSCDGDDTCPGANDAADADGDGAPNACDPCPADDPDDSDADGVCDSDDACPGQDDLADVDGDAVPDGCDPCPADNPDDTDGDGVCEGADVCPGFDDGIDADGDGTPDGCETPPPGGTALRFDGVNDYVEIPYDASMDTPPTGLTIEAWVYYDQIAANCMTVLRRGQSSSASQEYWLHKNMGPADSLHWAGWGSWTVIGWTAVAPGGWYHYAGTWDPAGDAAIWLNGALWATAAAGGPPATVMEPTRIGIDWDLGCGMDGVIDEVRISSVVRYTAPFVPATDLTADPSTLALWNFDEGAGTTAADSSGNGNHGTIYGASWTTEQP